MGKEKKPAKKKAEKPLNDMQKKFALEYIVDLNGKQAAIRAGYSEKTAQEQASRLLSNVKVQNEIQKQMDKRSARTEITADKVLNKLYDIANSDIKDFLQWKTEKTVVDRDEDGTPITDYHTFITLNDMDKVDGRLITKMKMGRNGIEFERQDPLKALELLGKHLKLFTDKVEMDAKGDVQVMFNIPRPNRSEGS
jgi:phage terminase small subunit